MNFATELLHGGLLPDKATGATTLPIYQTAAYNQNSAEDLEKIFSFRKSGFIYSRIGNPTTATFERRISDLERGADVDKFPKLAEFKSFGAMKYLARLRAKILTNFGGCPSPFNIFLTFHSSTRF